MIFHTDATIAPPPSVHARGCRCALHQRRLFTGMLGAGAAVAAVGAATPVLAQEGLRRDVGKESKFTKLVPAEDVEKAAALEYEKLKKQARQKKALAPASHPQMVRLKAIADRIIPYTYDWNKRARSWQWEVALIGSKELNAFCMPGGKIAYYYGILQRLQLTDDEVAMIMGHEMAHALREHARERMGKNAATGLGVGLISSIFGLGDVGNTLLNMGGQLLTLRFSREDESEADLVGLDLAARAGYNPQAGVTLWQKMLKANEGAPPEFMSTHPAGENRIAAIQAQLPKVEPLYARAEKPPKDYGPPRNSKG